MTVEKKINNRKQEKSTQVYVRSEKIIVPDLTSKKRVVGTVNIINRLIMSGVPGLQKNTRRGI